MPVIIPNRLPAGDTLKKENIFTMRKARAQTQDIRPLRIVIVNLMPTKIATETQLARVLANSPLQVELTLVHMDSHDAKNISQGHLDSFYKTIDEVKHEKFDGMILTGAPVEQIPFEDVDYWNELKEIMEWSKTNVYSTVHICWGAQAALYYHYGVPKYPVDKKVFGIFEQRVIRPLNPLMRGFDEVFFAPHSRHTTIKKEDVLQHKDLRILAESPESGLHILSNENGRMIFILGHQEYDKETLGTEYFRDVDKGLPIDLPKNYFKDDDPTKEPIFRWRAHASLLFTNWLNYYVYQETPFDLESL